MGNLFVADRCFFSLEISSFPRGGRVQYVRNAKEPRARTFPILPKILSSLVPIFLIRVRMSTGTPKRGDGVDFDSVRDIGTILGFSVERWNSARGVSRVLGSDYCWGKRKGGVGLLYIVN
jgi:hypothetical protein